MKIAFTNTVFFLQKKGGISRYFFNLALELVSLKKKINIIAPLNKIIYQLSLHNLLTKFE
jgi:hypothetical protein